MMNDPLTHLHLHQLTTDEATARRRHHLDQLPRRHGPVRRLWASLRRAPVPRTTAAPARAVAVVADVGADVDSCVGTARCAPHAA